jgi:uncharacterized protein
MKQAMLSRRQLLLGAGATTLLAVVDAFGIEPRWLRVTEHDVPVAKLPKILDGYRIAQVTDAHLKHIGLVEEAIIREIGQRDVALVLLTGDMIDDPPHLRVLEEFCHSLQSSGRTVLATLGNWEHWARIPLSLLLRIYQSQKVNLLINESVSVGSAIYIAATDDSTGGTVLLDRIAGGFPAAEVSLFLTHSPELLDRIPKAVGHFDLSLAGHTHGGQGRIGSFAPFLPPGSGRFLSGWYRVPIGRAYVCCGTGTTAIPARFSCRPELPIFTLRQG